MFKQLLSNTPLFGALLCVIVFIVGGLLYLQFVQRQAARDLQRTQDIPEQRDNPQKAETEPQTTTGGHLHDDGTFHADPHETRETAPAVVNTTSSVAASRDYTPAAVQIPEGITDPDVLAAWKRVEYIANNIW